jgi:AraC-like DNA-binding protein
MRYHASVTLPCPKSAFTSAVASTFPPTPQPPLEISSNLTRVYGLNGSPSIATIVSVSLFTTVGEADVSDSASKVLVAKLSELLFVETLRRYISSLPPDQTGWLAGTRDPVVGQALALLHKEPAHPWTVSNLARRVGLSRTRLAERFRYFTGNSPMAYLSQWRLKVGAEMLQSTEDSIAQVAAMVGYGSEAAFNRAFRREFDSPPAQFRRLRKAASNQLS